MFAKIRARRYLKKVYSRKTRTSQKAATALGKLKHPSVVEPLIKTLEEGKAFESNIAVEVLGIIQDVRAVEPLINALKNDESLINRGAVAEALGKIGDPRAVDPLIATLKDKDWNVRESAAEALEQLGWKPDRGDAGAQYWIARKNWEAASALGSAAVDPLIAALKDKDWNVREAAAEALAKVGDPHVKERVLTEVQLMVKGDLTDVAATGTAKEATLLVKAGADVNVRTSGGYTPLVIAAARGKIDVVQVLLGAGANIYLTGKDGISAEFKAYDNSRKTDLNKHYIETYKLLEKTRKKIEAAGHTKPSVSDDPWELRRGLPSEFVDNGDGTVTDKKRRLVWQRAEDRAEYNYQDALAYCSSLELAGHRDWRLPIKEELVDLATEGFDTLQQVFPDIQAERYWAHTSKGELSWAEAPERIAYTVEFAPHSGNYGRAVTYFRTYSYFVRAVRDSGERP